MCSVVSRCEYSTVRWESQQLATTATTTTTTRMTMPIITTFDRSYIVNNIFKKHFCCWYFEDDDWNYKLQVLSFAIFGHLVAHYVYTFQLKNTIHIFGLSFHAYKVNFWMWICLWSYVRSILKVFYYLERVDVLRMRDINVPHAHIRLGL